MLAATVIVLFAIVAALVMLSATGRIVAKQQPQPARSNWLLDPEIGALINLDNVRGFVIVARPDEHCWDVVGRWARLPDLQSPADFRIMRCPTEAMALRVHVLLAQALDAIDLRTSA